MLDDINDLYQNMILDHSSHPHNWGRITDSTHQAHGYNPLCGDDLWLYLEVEAGRIKTISFVGEGCAISKASASMMTEAIKGKSLEEARDLFGAFHILLTEAEKSPDEKLLGKLVVFKGVQQFPIRVKCATLAWHTLQAALTNKNESVSTE